MKTKKGFRLRELGSDYILIGESVELINFNSLITLNESAAYLWRNVDGKDFNAETAQRDAEATLQDWLEAGIITE